MLQEFQAVVNRKKILESVSGGNSEFEYGLSFRDTQIEDLCLDFSLPGYPDVVLASWPDHTMVRHCLIYLQFDFHCDPSDGRVQTLHIHHFW